jgi:hypothetical protein
VNTSQKYAIVPRTTFSEKPTQRAFVDAKEARIKRLTVIEICEICGSRLRREGMKIPSENNAIEIIGLALERATEAARTRDVGIVSTP